MRVGAEASSDVLMLRLEFCLNALPTVNRFLRALNPEAR